MADVTNSPGIPGTLHKDDSESSLNTIPDPRTASSSDLSRTGSHSPRHPDLSAEVANLSDKLINAINHQTTLDDTLSRTRHELESSRARIQQLEAEAQEHEEKLATGALLTKDAHENVKGKLIAELEAERKSKSVVQQEKRGIEQELETLTAQLFEEANKMVAEARREKDAIQKKNEQLRDQIKDTEMLLASQQEQLTELKVVMQQMNDGDDRESVRTSTAPSSPGVHRDETITRLMDVMNLAPSSFPHGDTLPAPATTYTHLMKTVCRVDLPAYEDFKSLITVAKSQPASRVTSGNYAGLNVMGLAGLGGGTNNASSTSLNGAGSTHTPPPSTPGSFNSTPKDPPMPLKETKFYKRILTEDIEPTLRLDLAPGISWLTRRSLTSAIGDGSLIVEPIPEASRKLYGRYTSCSVCGENRKGDENPRTHRMRTSDAEGASRWQLCSLCLEKVRATCDLVGFVKMVKDGVVRIREGDLEQEHEAWEELVRLRERMFWARMAAGMIPAFMEKRPEKGSPSTGRPSQDSRRSATISPPSSSSAQRSDLTTTNASSSPQTSQNSSSDTSAEEATQQLESSLQHSLNDNKNPPPVPERNMERTGSSSGGNNGDGGNKSLKVTIPGGFE